MKSLAVLALLIVTATMFTVARSGHEFPVYPSYYPHEIRIETIAPDRAAALLEENKIHAYVGNELSFGRNVPDSIRPIESLGSFVVVRVNPASSLAADGASACGLARSVVREIATHGKAVTIHPYPVTPLQGDYLYYADLADVARTHFLGEPPGSWRLPQRRLKVRAGGLLARSLVRHDWITQGPDWDAAVEEVSVTELVASAITQLNGWLGPPWIRSGWFQAVLLLGSGDDASARQRVDADVRRLQTRAYANRVERINLERGVVTSLTSGCRSVVAGYTVKREYANVEYSAGIENLGFDSLTGLNSPIFIRTVKLKDFPWNGWLLLGIDAQPTAAWNPIAGFTDDFGRLMWSAVGDPALMPSPDGAGWMLNRVSDVQAAPGP